MNADYSRRDLLKIVLGAPVAAVTAAACTSPSDGDLLNMYQKFVEKSIPFVESSVNAYVRTLRDPSHISQISGSLYSSLLHAALDRAAREHREVAAVMKLKPEDRVRLIGLIREYVDPMKESRIPGGKYDDGRVIKYKAVRSVPVFEDPNLLIEAPNKLNTLELVESKLIDFAPMAIDNMRAYRALDDRVAIQIKGESREWDYDNKRTVSLSRKYWAPKEFVVPEARVIAEIPRDDPAYEKALEGMAKELWEKGKAQIPPEIFRGPKKRLPIDERKL